MASSVAGTHPRRTPGRPQIRGARSGDRPERRGRYRGEAYWGALRTLREELEGLAADGIVLRDAESGLVDFPAKREGRVIQLCWRRGEERVAYWHEVDAGFGNRIPLEP